MGRGTPVSLTTAEQTGAKVGVFDGCGGVIMQATADGFGMRPASSHMGRALAHELAPRIGRPEQRAKLNSLNVKLRILRLRRLKLR